MSKATMNKIVKKLEKEGFDVSKQALGFLDMLNKDGDEETTVKDFVDWYKKEYAKVINGKDVVNYMMYAAHRRGN